MKLGGYPQVYALQEMPGLGIIGSPWEPETWGLSSAYLDARVILGQSWSEDTAKGCSRPDCLALPFLVCPE